MFAMYQVLLEMLLHWCNHPLIFETGSYKNMHGSEGLTNISKEIVILNSSFIQKNKYKESQNKCS
jgi:hypothetical protein